MNEKWKVLRAGGPRELAGLLPTERLTQGFQRLLAGIIRQVLRSLRPVRAELDALPARERGDESNQLLHGDSSAPAGRQCPDTSISRKYEDTALLSASTSASLAVAASRTALSTSGHVRRPAAN